MPKPNFFLVGAPKCGTTSLYEYLRVHPEIFMPEIKEPHYFAKDMTFNAPWHVRDWDRYIALFEGADSATRIGEGSVYYLYSRTAAREIRDFNADAKIIIMLRNPPDMMYSLHGQFLSSHNENIADFAEALNAETERGAGQRIPSTAHSPHVLCYAAVARYCEQVQRYLETFGRDNVHVILFDDLATDTPGVYRRALEFLGVDPEFRTTFPKFNVGERKTLRNMRLRHVLSRSPVLRKTIAVALPDTARGMIGSALAAVTGSQINRPKQIAPELRRSLLNQFSGEIEQLGHLIGRDLSSWFN